MVSDVLCWSHQIKQSGDHQMSTSNQNEEVMDRVSFVRKIDINWADDKALDDKAWDEAWANYVRHVPSIGFEK